MSELTLNGTPVLRGRITLPRLGAWTADLLVDTATVPTGRVVLTAQDGRSLVGTIARGNVVSERSEVRVVGGGAGGARVLDARYYRGASADLPLRDLLRDAGEEYPEQATLSAEAREKLSQVLRAWTRERCEAARSLRQLCEAIGLSFRVAADGRWWFGVETWPTAPEVNFELVRDEPARDRLEIACDIVPLAIEPGMVVLDQRVSLIEHSLGETRTRTVLHFEQAGSAIDRLREAFEKAVRAATAATDFHVMYPARVVAQSDDGSLEVIVDGDRIPPLTSVPLRLSIPGKVRVSAGARVLVGFDGGRPDHPYASLWESAALERAELGAATLGVARETDDVAVGKLVIVRNDQRDDLYWLPPGAGDNGWKQVPVIGSAPTLASDGRTLTGKITGHSEKVFAE